MSDRDRLRSETHAYLSKSNNKKHYLDSTEVPGVMKELTQRVLNARSWIHDLPSFDAVQEVVTAAAAAFGDKKQ